MSKLSVNADVFVPCQTTLATGRLTAALPQYVTSCYPFVQGDPGILFQNPVPVATINGHALPPPQVFHTSQVAHLACHSDVSPHVIPTYPGVYPLPPVFAPTHFAPPPSDVACSRPPAATGQNVVRQVAMPEERTAPKPIVPHAYKHPRPSAAVNHSGDSRRPSKPVHKPLKHGERVIEDRDLLRPKLHTRVQCYPSQPRMVSPRHFAPRYLESRECRTPNVAPKPLPVSMESGVQADLPCPPASAAQPSLDHVIVENSVEGKRATIATQTLLNPVANIPQQPSRISYANAIKSVPQPRAPSAVVTISSTASPGVLLETAARPELVSGEAEPIKKRRKRSRRRKKRDDENEYENQRISPEPVLLAAADLRFEDESEFPGLLENTQNAFKAYSSNLAASYSTAHTGSTPAWSVWNNQARSAAANVVQPMCVSSDEHVPKPVAQSLLTRSGHSSNASSTRSLDKAGKENRVQRKRRKRRDLANEAAEKELLEISLEQQVLKQIGIKTKVSKPAAPVSQRRSKEPVALNIAEMISALEQQQQQQQQSAGADDEKKHKMRLNKDTTSVTKVGFVHDSVHISGPNLLDSNPTVKRGKERETPKNKKPSTLKKVILKEREDRRRMRWLDGTNLGAITQSFGEVGETCPSDNEEEDGLPRVADVYASKGSGELSPVSQDSPISMSPVSPGGSPLSSEVNSPVQPGFVKSPAAMAIHSRRFREYCNQILDRDIDACCVALLQDLVRFQDRIYHKEPSKLKSKRRFVLGLREVTKHLKLKKIKCVVISPNLERIQAKGGLDEALNVIISLCQEQNVPFVFALGRRALGRACAKLVPVSVVGVFNYDGSEEHYKKLMDLTVQAREQYNKMVNDLEVDCDESGAKPPHAQSASPSPVYAHMGHSRTPSGCSGISFASSMMSEPISELGREDVTKLSVPEKTEYFRRAHLSHSRNSSLGKVSIVESITETDEGCYEADTEDPPDTLTVDRREADLYAEDADEVDTIEELPTLMEQEHMHDQLSSHSSRTLTTPLVTATSSERSEDVDRAAMTHRLKVIDQERIESWVEKAASSIHNLRLSDVEEGDKGRGEGT